MAKSTGDGRRLVTERVRELVKALRVAPAVQHFQAAEKRLRTDRELGRMQAGLCRKYERLQRAVSQGRHDATLFAEVREAKARIQQHPLVGEFVTSRDAVQDFLRQVNAAMTEVLGVDVGASAGRAGGC